MAFRQHARVRPDPTAAIEGFEGAEDVQVVATVERADLRAALDHLNDRDRKLLEMRYQEDLTQAEIAAKLGIPEGTAKVRLHRARDRLRRAYVLPVAAPTAGFPDPGACTQGRSSRGELQTAG